MVYVSKLWHACSTLLQTIYRYLPSEQKYKLEGSSTTSGRIALGGGSFESAGQDDLNSIRLEGGVCL